jgi:hypothetical protein
MLWWIEAEKCALAEKARDLDARELAIRETLGEHERLMAQHHADEWQRHDGGGGVGVPSLPPNATVAAGDPSSLPPVAAP